MNIEIVRAQEEHLPAIGELWWEFILFHASIEPWFTPQDGAIQGFLSEHVSRFMASERGLALVALGGSVPIAYALAEVQGPGPGLKQQKWGYIDQVAVTESHRRKGVGERLFAEIMAWFKSHGITRVELELTASNYISTSFWGKHGFREYMRRMYLETAGDD